MSLFFCSSLPAIVCGQVAIIVIGQRVGVVDGCVLVQVIGRVLRRTAAGQQRLHGAVGHRTRNNLAGRVEVKVCCIEICICGVFKGVDVQPSIQ